MGDIWHFLMGDSFAPLDSTDEFIALMTLSLGLTDLEREETLAYQFASLAHSFTSLICYWSPEASLTLGVKAKVVHRGGFKFFKSQQENTLFFYICVYICEYKSE